MRARAADDPHHRQPLKEPEFPIIMADYCFMQDSLGGELFTILDMLDVALGNQRGGNVNSFSPIQQNSMKNGYEENHNYNKSDETKCEINYSIITNNKWNVNTHNNMQLTKHDTNDDVDFDNCVVHTVR